MSKSKGFLAGVIVTAVAGVAAYAAYKTVKRLEFEKIACCDDCEDCNYYEDCYGDCCDCCSDSVLPDEEIAYCDCKSAADENEEDTASESEE